MSTLPWITTPGVPPGIQAKAQKQARAEHPWYRIENTAGDEAEMLIYDEIGGWFGSTADDVVAELRAVTASKIRVRINSPGGSVFDGIAIANALRAHPAEVTVQVDGIAASIASVIAMAGDRLVMMPSSTLMIHDASGLCMGNSADMQQMADLLDKLSDNIADVYATKGGGTREQWRDLMQEETWYLADEAVAAGLADEVAPGRTAAEPAVPGDLTNTWDLSVFRYAGRADAPAPVLNTTPEPEPPPVMEPDPEPAPEPPAEPSLPPGVEPGVGNPGDGGGTEEDPPAEGRVTEPSDSAAAPAAAADTEWADLVARLTTPPPSADDEFTRLKEALL
ncbi:head maturation protease, ClpP-related [Streptomyces niveus]|uniref:head maturation protease, ClpP-related n=1 Tax=Streptomyces niveus TaxID=193462 RepID=UPI0034295DC5